MRDLRKAKDVTQWKIPVDISNMKEIKMAGILSAT